MWTDPTAKFEIEVKITKEMIDTCRPHATEIGRLKNSIRKGNGNLIGVLGELLVHQALPGSIWTPETVTPSWDIIDADGKRIEVKTKETEHDGNPEAADDRDAATITISSALWLIGIRSVEEV